MQHSSFDEPSRGAASSHLGRTARKDAWYLAQKGRHGGQRRKGGRSTDRERGIKTRSSSFPSRRRPSSLQRDGAVGVRERAEGRQRQESKKRPTVHSATACLDTTATALPAVIAISPRFALAPRSRIRGLPPLSRFAPLPSHELLACFIFDLASPRPRALHSHHVVAAAACPSCSTLTLRPLCLPLI